MDLANKQVMHQKFGKGNVVKCSDAYIKIDFPSGEKKFVFPDAFEKYLTLTNEEAAEKIRGIVQKHAAERMRLRELKISKRKAKLRIIEQKRLPRKSGAGRIHPCSQSAFWCKDEEIDNIFEEWNIFTGRFKSGKKKDQPRKLARINKNTACLLTTRKQNEPEQQRRIIGMFMVEKTFDTRLCKDGYIPSHPKHRLRLAQDGERMFFWNYYVSKRYPHKITWNSGRHRYFDNIWMAQILRDILHRVDAEQLNGAQQFFEYFCNINKINKYEIPEPGGALRLENTASETGESSDGLQIKE